MSLVNYVLVGLLGAIVAVALYAARWDMSQSSAVEPPRHVLTVG